jgi:hypothetical protein
LLRQVALMLFRITLAHFGCQATAENHQNLSAVLVRADSYLCASASEHHEHPSLKDRIAQKSQYLSTLINPLIHK